MDWYTVKARLRPALLTVLPVGLAIVAWFPDRLWGWSGLGGLLTACGLTMLMSELARDRGKRFEPDMFDEWGGKPSTQLLRHRNNEIDCNTKARYHAKLAALLPTLHIPTAHEEDADPSAADQAYNSCVSFLLEHTRDQKRFFLIFKELTSYGFRRNLWGLKPYGIIITILALVACGASFIYAKEHARDPASLAATGVCLVLFLCWLFVIKPVWIRSIAFAYARQLLAACEVLDTPKQHEMQSDR